MLTHYRRWQLIRTVGTGRMSGDKYFYRISVLFTFNYFAQTEAASLQHGLHSQQDRPGPGITRSKCFQVPQRVGRVRELINFDIITQQVRRWH